MKQLILLLFLGTTFVSNQFNYENDSLAPALEHHSFSKGEHLDYQVNFGFFKAGEARMVIEDKLYQIKNKPCFKIDFYGKTTGALSWVADVDDNWGAYVDAVDIKPHISYRNIRENNYRKKEVVEFNHRTNQIHYKDLDVKTGKVKSSEVIEAQDQIFDIICGMAHMRNYDMNALNLRDTLEMKAYFEDTIYNFKIVYYGKDEVKTKAGNFKSHVFKPIMPPNKLFNGNQPITVWFSDDKNQIPVRIDADFTIGKGKCMLSDFHNLKSKPEALD